MKRAVLLSGGVDSCALAWWKRPDIAYTIDYGQSAAKAEIQAAGELCRQLRCEHVILRIDAAALGAGLLAGKPSSGLSRHSEWWPFRNQFLLTVSGMHSVQNGVKELMIGSVATDTRHADGRPAFVRSMNTLMSRQEGRLRIKAPAIGLSAVELLRRARMPAAVLVKTHSCHTGNVHCCECPGCRKRLELFRELGLNDD